MALYYSDLETQEAMRRLKEVAFTFGLCSFSEIGAIQDLIGLEVRVLGEFLELLRKRENKRQNWGRHSPQLKYRGFLVDFVMKLCSFHLLTSETAYLAIYLVDRFMDRNEVNPKRLGALAIVCVSLSGKLLETDYKTPKYKHLAGYLKIIGPTTVQYLVSLEAYVLASYNFDILVPTEVNFLDAYLLYAIDGISIVQQENANNNNNSIFITENATDDNNNGALWEDSDEHNAENDEENGAAVSQLFEPFPVVGRTQVLKDIHELAFMILERLTRKGEPNNNFKPSLTAAAILLAARREHGLNFWTATLERITSYSLFQVYNCLKTYVEPILLALNLKQPFSVPHYKEQISEPCVQDGV